MAPEPSSRKRNFRKSLHHYGNLFEDWEIAITKGLILEYCEKWTLLNGEGFDDLLQECLTHYLLAKTKYVPKDDATLKSFARRVIKNELNDIVRRVYRHKRKALYEAIPLDEAIKTDEDKAPFVIHDHPSKSITKTELTAKIQKAFDKLTPRQRELCRLLYEEGLNVNEASKYFNLHRRTVYKEVLRIREIFEEEGLRDYLE